MRVRVGINGMGRIGRDLMRIATDRAGSASETAIEVVAVNDLTTRDARPPAPARLDLRAACAPPSTSTPPAAARRRRSRHRACCASGTRRSCRGPTSSVDLVIESTGRFRTRDAARTPQGRRPEGAHLGAGQGGRRHHRAGVNPTPTTPRPRDVVSGGVLHHQLRGAHGQGPARGFGIEQGFLTTVHATPTTRWTSSTPPQGPAPGPTGGGEHHPDQHRRRQGHRPRSARAGRPARRRRPAGPGRRLDDDLTAAWPNRPRPSRSTRPSTPQPKRSSRASCGAPRNRWCPTTSSVPRCTAGCP